MDANFKYLLGQRVQIISNGIFGFVEARIQHYNKGLLYDITHKSTNGDHFTIEDVRQENIKAITKEI